MCRYRNRLILGMIVSLLTACAGCHIPKGFSLPWSKPAPHRWQQASAPAEIPPSLTDKQKTNLQIAMAVAAERQGRLDEAKKIYQDLIKTAPKRIELYHRLALLHRSHAAVCNGRRDARRGVRQPGAMVMDGRVEPAEAAYRHALQVNPSLQTAREGLATLQSLSTHQVASHTAPIHRPAPSHHGGPYDRSGFRR